VTTATRSWRLAGGLLAGLVVALLAGVGAYRAHSSRVVAEARAAREAREELTGKVVVIEGGSFAMGSSEGEEDEKPVHRVVVASFAMDATEVTVAAYEACVQAGGCSRPDTGPHCNGGQAGKSRHPINCVDWNQATAFCAWAGKRLPTEEEWEYTARGVDSRRYPWGDTAPDAQLCWQGTAGTCEVGSHESGQTPAGVQDMAGNVWEWAGSQQCPYTPSGYDLRECRPSRVFRGGGWGSGEPSAMRGAARRAIDASQRNFLLGFRCARAL
jgi:formylglycine-generating enzyme required for sulfatase activity